jgi:hypothetical protein
MVAKAEPEVIVHQLTALIGPVSFRNVKRMATVQCHVEVRVREWDASAVGPRWLCSAQGCWRQALGSRLLRITSSRQVIVVCAGLCRIFGIILHNRRS